MPNKTDNKTFAYNAAVEASTRSNVGFFIEFVEEDEGVVTYLFESKLKGYVGWRWSVSVFQGESEAAPTVSEVLLVPGPESLVAPDWVPWSERLADYKALQAELEAQAALDAEEADDDVDGADEENSDDIESGSDEESVVEESSEIEEHAESNDETAEDSALSDVEEGVEAEADSGKARKLPRFLRRRNRGSGKKKND